MSARGRAMAGRFDRQVTYVLWAAAIGEDYERVDLFDALDEALAAAHDLAAQRRHVALQITCGRKVVRRLPVGDQEVA